MRALAEGTGLRDCVHDDVVRITGRAASRGSTLWFDDDPRSQPRRGASRSRAPGCLRHDLGTCAGPCIGAGASQPYRDAAVAVRAFLDGQSDAPVRSLEMAMHHAAEQLAFEHAAVIRDRLALVSWLHERVQNFHANVDRLTFRYHAVGPGEQEWVYLVRRGTVRAELPAPKTREERVAFRELAAKVFQGPDPLGADIPTHDLDEFYLVASWFRRRPNEKARTRVAIRRTKAPAT